MTGTITTPATDHLFKVRDNVLKLNKKIEDLFYRDVVQILDVAQSGRPDHQIVVYFLIKRVQAPAEDD